MTEDKNGVKNGEATTEMAPQEDGTKVPLTDNACAEVKFTSSDPPNGDAKIDMGTVPVFQGLSKEELMKYSDDPFWIRLRWFLFILFWAGWLAMLVVAIIIIVQAPRCAPQEQLEWIQESAILQYDAKVGVDADNNGDVNPNDVVEMAKVLGMTSVYLEGLINPLDFTKNSDSYTDTEVEKILTIAKQNKLNVVTDFIPAQVPDGNTWFANDSYKEFFVPGSSEFDFSNQDLLNEITALLRDHWVSKGVKAFFMGEANTPDLRNARDVINEALKTEVDGAVVSNLTDMASELVSGFNAEFFQAFLSEHVDDWSYYKYNPKVAESQLSAEEVRLITLSLFLVPGTPIISGFNKEYLEEHNQTIKALSNLRTKESVEIGSIAFLNATDSGVVAYARIPKVLKGAPGYAVAVNLHATNNATVDFTSVSGVEGSGDVSLKATFNETITTTNGLGKQDLSDVYLGPSEGIVIQFVPSL